MRYALLSLVVTRLVWGLLLAAPLTLNVSHWSATASNATLALLMDLTLFAFYASRAGRVAVRNGAQELTRATICCSIRSNSVTR